MTKHTPGPWVVDEQSQSLRILAGRQVVADVSVYAFECGANSRLIAAAPDLLEALKRLRDWHRIEYLSHPDVDAVADAAIAKAEGTEV